MSQYGNDMYQAFGSPMLGSTIVTAPRRDGDGMDQESMLREIITTPSGGNTAGKTRRHTNLTSTVGEQRVEKADKVGGRRIEHEPVRGAVRAVSSTEKKPTSELKPSPSSDKLTPNTSASDIRILGLPQKKVLPAPTTSDLSVTSDLTVTPDPEVREVEGHVRVSPEQEIERLNLSVAELQDQLHVQSKVNSDLKKMLVASMGDDLHHKVDTLVRTKAQLACDIGGYTDRIYEDHETLDKLSIQADLWRSKYNGLRVLVDQLVRDKETASTRWMDAERTLQQFLQERDQLRESLVETHRYLKLLRDSFDPVASRRPSPTIPNVLELARTTHLLADCVKFRLLPAMPVFSAALDAGIQNGATPAEKLARQMLSLDPLPEDPAHTGASLVRLSPDIKYDRFHPSVRYENITFNCCAKCTGEVKVV